MKDVVANTREVKTVVVVLFFVCCFLWVLLLLFFLKAGYPSGKASGGQADGVGSILLLGLSSLFNPWGLCAPAGDFIRHNE